MSKRTARWVCGLLIADAAKKHLRRMATQRATGGGPTSLRNATARPSDMGGSSSTNTSPSKPQALPRDKGLGDYIEFDLTRLHNSKGGFLVEENEGADLAAKLEDERKERERERQRLRDQMEPGISLDPTTRPLCELCKSSDVVYDPFLRVFNVRVCRACERENPERYSLLTKTEVKEVCPVGLL